ncbi:hypothetical protein ACR3K2_21160, partial [Cryptosporidium serpentis]
MVSYFAIISQIIIVTFLFGDLFTQKVQTYYFIKAIDIFEDNNIGYKDMGKIKGNSTKINYESYIENLNSKENIGNITHKIRDENRPNLITETIDQINDINTSEKNINISNSENILYNKIIENIPSYKNLQLLSYSNPQENLKEESHDKEVTQISAMKKPVTTS